MSQDVIVSSTTDTQEQVNAAAGVSEEAKPEVSEEETADVEVSEPEKAETDSESETEPESEPEKPVTRSDKKLLKRIDKITARHYADQERLAEMQKRLEAIERAEKPAEAKAAKANPDGRPNEDDYTDWKVYQADLVRWEVRQARAEDEAKAADATKTETRKKTYDAFIKRLGEFASTVDDFDEVAAGAPYKVPESVELLQFELDNGPQLGYYLAKHPEILEELNQMSDLNAAGYAWHIAKQLASEGAPKPKPTSRAPAPIKPVAGGSTRSSVPLDQLDYQAYRKARDAQSQD